MQGAGRRAAGLAPRSHRALCRVECRPGAHRACTVPLAWLLGAVPFHRWGHTGPLPASGHLAEAVPCCWDERQFRKYLPAVKLGSGTVGQGTQGTSSPPGGLGMLLTNHCQLTVRGP